MKKRKMISWLLIGSMVISMTACGSKSATTGTAPANETKEEATDSNKQATGDTSAGTQDLTDPDFVYSPEITLTTVRRTQQNVTYQNGDTIENNSWTRFLKKHGINIEYVWTADASQYSDKLSMSIAAGEIPDFISFADINQANTMKQGNMLFDMKPVLEQYLTPLAKSILYSDEGIVMDALTEKSGEQYVIGNGQDLRTEADVLWIRKDWLDKLNLEAPKTVDDLLKITDAFTNQDPDGNGVKDTYGLAVAGKDNLIRDWAGLTSFFPMFGVNPGYWWDNSLFYEKDSTGKLIWSGSKPEMKDALTTLQTMYSKGYLSKDFGTADAGGKVASDLAAGRVGMFFGPAWCASWPLQDVLKNNSNADWTTVLPPTIDGSAYKMFGFFPGSSVAVVSQQCKNPEAIVRIMNWYAEFAYGENKDETLGGDTDFANNAGEGKYNCPMALTNRKEEQERYTKLNEARKAGASADLSDFSSADKQYFEDWSKYDSDATYLNGWAASRTYDSQLGVNRILYNDLTLDDVQKSAYMGGPLESFNKVSSIYKKMAEETITKIIYGNADVSEWDNMVENWNKLGGDSILKEIEATQNNK